MKRYDFPCDFAKAIGGVSVCPELEDAILSGGYTEGHRFEARAFQESGKVEEVAKYSVPGTREVYVYRVQAYTSHSGKTWWHAYGEYCPFGKSVADADCLFLDGGGFFEKRSAALWAIHLWLAHLHRFDVTTPSEPKTPDGN